MELRFVTAILLFLSVWTCPGLAWAEEDDDPADSVENGDMSEPDPWERPPEDQESPRGGEKAVPAERPLGDGRPLQIGLALGWGFETEKNSFGAHPYGLGGGLRVGYTLDMGVYFGLSTTYFLGSTRDGGTAGIASPRVNNSVSAWLINLEVGYDVWLGPVIFRPSAEIGTALTFLTYDQRTGGSSTRGALALAPGASLIYPFDELYLGGDMRLVIPVGDSAQGTLAAFLIGGMRFDTKIF